MPLRIWSETATPAELRTQQTHELLRRHHCTLALAVRPGGTAEAKVTWNCLQDAGIKTAIWPMVEDIDGRWLSHASLSAFEVLWAEVGEAFRDVAALELVLDVEAPFGRAAAWLPADAHRAERPGAYAAWAQRVRTALTSIRSIADKPHPSAAATMPNRNAAMQAALQRLAHAGYQLSSAELPTTVLPHVAASGWAQHLGLPLPATWAQPNSTHHVMLYSSLLEGWSRGAFARSHAEYALFRCAQMARTRFGERAAVALGVLGAGAFGQEPAYRGPEELARDVALCRGAGISQFSLFDLGGLLRQPDPEYWLSAFQTEAANSPPRKHHRVDIALSVLAALGYAGRTYGD
jgi:hypothetical protein